MRITKAGILSSALEAFCSAGVPAGTSIVHRQVLPASRRRYKTKGMLLHFSNPSRSLLNLVLHCTSIFLPALLFSTPVSAADIPLSVRYEKLRAEARDYGKDGTEVLRFAYDAIRNGNYRHVGIEDLWTTALQEGKSLFGTGKLWSVTGPAFTGDMLGQTTIGPWQVTIQNLNQYKAEELTPELQARIAADLIEESYERLGKRSPLAIQSYFWLEAFEQKKIGQGLWYNSVLAKTPGAMKNTGFYAKQIVLGSHFNSRGLLYWLYVTGDEDAIRDVLRTWARNGFPIRVEDLQHCACDPEFRRHLSKLLHD